MAIKKPLINTKITGASKAMTNAQANILKNPNGANATKLAEIAKERTVTKQLAIDTYNSETCNIIDPFFNDFQLTGRNVIIRLHKENYIKDVVEYADKSVTYDAWISQVDGRMHNSNPANWMDNPLPFVFTGVIVAMSPLVTMELEKDHNELRKTAISLASNYKVLSVGDIIHLEHFMFADKRFYINKQKRDFIKNPEQFRINNWEGYVKIHHSLIEGLIKNPESFLGTTSAYQVYQNNK